MASLYKARVSDYKKLAAKFQNIHLELVEPNRLDFVAGQYVMLKVPGEARMRQYSIASVPTMNHAVELLVDFIPGGKGSEYLASLKPGDEVEFMAPAGKFVIAQKAESVEEKLWFVVTGSGIVPVKSMIMDLLIYKKDKRQIWLHWGLRRAEDVFWFDDFARLAEEYDNFNFDLTLSKPVGDWELCRGYVTKCLFDHHEKIWDKEKSMGIYLCGNKRMIDDVSKKLFSAGISKERIHTEQFYE